eukprot:TRINITY_DN31213_c0_g1_i1.p1 TRINITY_DN31213_c0_g1~~TRINITY_DN31213_c0_g1_i1.p1  ORF type:complete len:545 (+),score=90.13 TRINITY_DN31213_c0_g1_i1:82-1635(+)
MGSGCSGGLVEAPSFYCQFKLLDKLGEGTYGKVYACEDKLTNEQYAVKSQASRMGKEHVILSEMKVWKNLGRHPNIVHFREMRQEANVFFMLMEKCPSPLYDRVVKNPKWTAKELMSDFRQALHGLVHMHSLRIVHRDIKVQNFLYGRKDDQQILKITDFGLSVRVPQRKRLDPLCGSPAFMAPEMVLKMGYGLEIDMWALGVTFFMMMYGALLVGKSTMTVPEMKEAIKSPDATKRAMELAVKKAEMSLDDVRDLRFASLDVVKALTIRDPFERPRATAMLKYKFLAWTCGTLEEERRLATVLVVNRPVPLPHAQEVHRKQRQDRNRAASQEEEMTPVLPGEQSSRLSGARPVDMAELKKRLESRGLSDASIQAESKPPTHVAGVSEAGPSQAGENSQGLVPPGVLSENMFSDDRMLNGSARCVYNVVSNASSALALNSGGLNLDNNNRGSVLSLSDDQSLSSRSIRKCKDAPQDDPPHLAARRFHGEAEIKAPGALDNRELTPGEPAPEPDDPQS